MKAPVWAFMTLILIYASANAQVPQRDEAYWKAQQNVELTRRNALAAQERAQNGERALRDAKAARVAAEKQLEKTRQQEADAQAALPTLTERHRAAVQMWEDAKVEFEGIRK